MDETSLLTDISDEFMCNNLLTADDLNFVDSPISDTDIRIWLDMDSDSGPTSPPTDLSLQDLHQFDIGEHINGKIFDENVPQLPPDLLLPEPGDLSFDDYLQHSDSSDSGIYASTVKEEPPSPTSTTGSDVSEDYVSSPDILHGSLPLKMDPIKVEPLTDLSPQTLPEQVALPLVTTATTAAGGAIFINTVPGTVLGGPQPQASIHNILNSKVKIQPKPQTSALAKETAPPVVPTPRPLTNSQPLVVTPQQFQQMTAQGTLRWQQPAAQAEVNCRNSLSELDSKQRRQQRMIKNRESASLSRKRKKEYLQELESRIKVLTMENQELRTENAGLKNKLREIQQHTASLVGGSASRALKRGSMFLMVGFLLCFNFVPWASVMVRNDGPLVPLTADVHTGRHLLSVSEEPKDPAREVFGLSASELPLRWQRLKEELQDGILNGMFNETSLGMSMCPSYFNSTESLRLAEQLAGWMVLQEEEQQRKMVKRRREQRKKAYHPVRTLKTALHGSFQLYKHGGLGAGEPTYQVQVYHGQADQRQEFLKAIHRRNDTFYVLSFNTDYFLVPALAHNKTMRPRMSLVMPALGFNETMQPPPGQVGMMQIDCEVFNTQLIHVEKSVVPPSFVNATFDSQKQPHDNL